MGDAQLQVTTAEGHLFARTDPPSIILLNQLADPGQAFIIPVGTDHTANAIN